MYYKATHTINGRSVDVSPRRAACPVADRLADLGWAVAEVRLYHRLDQGKVFIPTPGARGTEGGAQLLGRLEGDLRSVWAQLVLQAAAGEGPLAFEG